MTKAEKKETREQIAHKYKHIITDKYRNNYDKIDWQKKKDNSANVK